MSNLATESLIHHFSVADYHRLAETGILREDDKVELIEGRIVDMTPIGSRHASCVNRLVNLLTVRLRGKAIVSPQNPIDLNEYSEPEPDIAILKTRPDFYAERHPMPDVMLIIEVSDSSLEYDREVKIPVYAKAMIREVWLVS